MSVTGTSMHEARRIYALLGDIDILADKVSGKMERTTAESIRTYQVVQDLFILLRQSGLPPDLALAISFIQRLIISVNSLNTALMILEGATGVAAFAAGGLGVAVAGLALFTAIGSAFDRRMRR